MSRSCYSDDYGDDFPGQLALYRANVRRSIRSKAGQARLRELREALVALSVKELHAETFAAGENTQPQVCVLGAWALAKTGDVTAAAQMVSRDGDDHETAAALEPHGWPRLVVLDAVYYNDDGEWRHAETPAQRYERMLQWVNEQILDEERDTKSAAS